MTIEKIHSKYLKEVRKIRKRRIRKVRKRNPLLAVYNFFRDISYKKRLEKMKQAIKKEGFYHNEGIEHIINLYNLKIRPVRLDVILFIAGTVFNGILFTYTPLTQIDQKFITDPKFSDYIGSLTLLIFIVAITISMPTLFFTYMLIDRNKKWQNAIELLQGIRAEIIRDGSRKK